MIADHFDLVKMLSIRAQAQTERQCSKLLSACAFPVPDSEPLFFLITELEGCK